MLDPKLKKLATYLYDSYNNRTDKNSEFLIVDDKLEIARTLGLSSEDDVEALLYKMATYLHGFIVSKKEGGIKIFRDFLFEVIFDYDDDNYLEFIIVKPHEHIEQFFKEDNNPS